MTPYDEESTVIFGDWYYEHSALIRQFPDSESVTATAGFNENATLSL
jgi:hypothetical protein